MSTPYLESDGEGYVKLLCQRVAEKGHVANVEARQRLVERGHRPPLRPMQPRLQSRLGSRDQSTNCIRCTLCIRFIRCINDLNGIVTKVVVRRGVDRLLTTTISVPEGV